jgi:hypothetical protein
MFTEVVSSLPSPLPRAVMWEELGDSEGMSAEILAKRRDL